MYRNNAYINPNWKWVSYVENQYPGGIIIDQESYTLKNIKSFGIWRYPAVSYQWTLAVNSNAKIQRWIVSRLGVRQTTYTSVTFKEGELELFLDELDQMMEVLYGKA